MSLKNRNSNQDDDPPSTPVESRVTNRNYVRNGIFEIAIKVQKGYDLSFEQFEGRVMDWIPEWRVGGTEDDGCGKRDNQFRSGYFYFPSQRISFFAFFK